MAKKKVTKKMSKKMTKKKDLMINSNEPQQQYDGSLLL